MNPRRLSTPVSASFRAAAEIASNSRCWRRDRRLDRRATRPNAAARATAAPSAIQTAVGITLTKWSITWAGAASGPGSEDWAPEECRPPPWWALLPVRARPAAPVAVFVAVAPAPPIGVPAAATSVPPVAAALVPLELFEWLPLLRPFSALVEVRFRLRGLELPPVDEDEVGLTVGVALTVGVEAVDDEAAGAVAIAESVATGVVVVPEAVTLKVLEEVADVLAGREVGTAPLSPPSSEPVPVQRPWQSVEPAVLGSVLVSEPVEPVSEPVVLVWEPSELVEP
jgi:hypothetical protein